MKALYNKLQLKSLEKHESQILLNSVKLPILAANVYDR